MYNNDRCYDHGSLDKYKSKEWNIDDTKRIMTFIITSIVSGLHTTNCDNG